MPPITLQSKYPLSPRKLYKKVLEKWYLYLMFFVGTAVFMFAWITVADRFAEMLYSIPLVSALVALGVIVLRVWYVRVYIRSYFYDANEQFLTIKKGVFAPTEIHVQFAKIQDVYVDQDILDRILGLYDVHVASATMSSGIEAHIDGVEKEAAEQLRDMLLMAMHPGSTSGGAPSERPASLSVPVSLSSTLADVDGTAYPISSRWLIHEGLTTVAIYMVVSFFISMNALTPGKNGNASLASLFGLEVETVFVIGVALFCVAFIGHMFYLFFWRYTYSFMFLPQVIVVNEGVIAKSQKHLPYRSIQDVIVSQGVVERFLGIAQVRIQNAATGPVGKTLSAVSGSISIPGQSLEKANELRAVIQQRILAHAGEASGL